MKDIVITQERPSLDLAARITASGFAQPLTPELRIDVEQHLAEGQLVYSFQDHGTVHGYALFRTIGPVLYLGGIMLEPDIQGLGLARQVMQRAQADSGRMYLGLRTQSVRMWLAGERATTHWYPNPEQSHITQDDLREILPEFAHALGCSFPCTPGFYGAPLYGEQPRHSDPSLQAWWDELCDFKRGDAILCLGRLI